MAIDTEALLGAVGAGIESQSPQGSTANETKPADASATGEGAQGDEKDASQPGDAADEGGDAGESDAGKEGAADEESADDGSDADKGDEDSKEGTDGKGRVRDENGRFKTKKVEEKPVIPPAEGKKPDPLNDPIPQDLKKATKDRMESLITIAKDSTAKVTQLQDDRDFIVGKITETGASPDQYTQALGYLKAVNSRDPAQIRTVIPMLKQELVALCMAVGEPVDGINIIDGHDDLKQEVAAGKLTPQRANEIALTRNARQMQTTRERQQNEMQRGNDEVTAAINSGKAALNAVGAKLANDPHFAYKKAILVKSLKPVFAQINPAQWASTFEAAYQNIPDPVAAQPVAARIPARQPTRTSNPAGGTVKLPANLGEAISAGIEQGSRGR